MALFYYLWSRGRIRPSEAYKMRDENKAEYKMLKAFCSMEMREEEARLNIELAKAGVTL